MQLAVHVHCATLSLCHTWTSFCAQEDGTEETDGLLAAGADRVVDTDSGQAAGAALAVDEETDAATARTATGGLTDANEEVCLKSEEHSAEVRLSNR